MISSGATTRQAGIEEENIEVGRVEDRGGDSNEVVRGDVAEVVRGDPVEVEDVRRQGEEEEGLPSYLQAVAGGEEGTWLNLGYQP